MSSRFMTDPHQMRAMARRFEMHAQTVSDESGKMWASPQNVAGAGRSGQARVNQAFTNIVDMLHRVHDGLLRDAYKFETQEQGSRQTLSS